MKRLKVNWYILVRKKFLKPFNCVQKMKSGNLTILLTIWVYKNHIYLIHMYKQNFALINMRWLICYTTKPKLLIMLVFIKEVYHGQVGTENEF